MPPINGTNASEIIQGTGSGENMNGKKGNDVLIGKAGNDTLKGGNGNDILIGSAGNDVLEGGKGNDTLTGNAGRDIFKLDYKDNSRDLIIDFTKGQDSIDIKGINSKHIGFTDRYDSSLNNKVQYASSEGAFYSQSGIFAELSRAQTLTMSDFL